MVKHGRRKRQRLFVPRISASHLIGALASNDVDTTAFGSLLDQEVYAISMDVICAMHAHTPGEGPIVFGVAHSDYTAAEIEEFMEASASWQKGNKIANEQARRKVRIVGSFQGELAEETINDGQKQRIKLGFVIEDGKGLQLFAYNEGSSTLTTGTVLELKGAAFLKPR